MLTTRIGTIRSRHGATFAAISLLLASGLLGILSVRGDSIIVDEVAHLPAGYAAVTRADLRLNPEHPPLMKDLAGLSVAAWSWLTRTPIVFPDQLASWTTEVNDQWSFGPSFFFSANPSIIRPMLLWGRLPTVLLFLVFGYWFFHWLRKRWGAGTALLAVALYAFSPTLLAHARYITTDLGAAAAAFVSLALFIEWLEQPDRRRFLLAGVALGVSQLMKFSLLILLPVLIAATVVWVTLRAERGQSTRQILRTFLRRLGACLGLIAFALVVIVAPVYTVQTLGYPAAKQQQDTATLLARQNSPAAATVRWMAEQPTLRGFAQYLTGVLMVEERAREGSTTFFLGEVYRGGRTAYFPTVYLLKEPISLHILTLLAVGFLLWTIRSRFRQLTSAQFIRAVPEWIFILFVAVYWAISLRAQLNIGVRHILPTLPIIIALVSRGTVQLWRTVRHFNPLAGRITFAAVLLLVAWQMISVISIHPSYLAYFNGLISGPSQAPRYAVDSNLDWGQDLRRLGAFVQQHGIQNIAVDYFGKDSPELIMPGVMQRYHVEYGRVRGWLAVSLTYLSSERGKATPSFPKGANRYAWLDRLQPVAVIGQTIAVYYIP